MSMLYIYILLCHVHICFTLPVISIPYVFKELSTKCGMALEYIIALHVPTNVKEGTNISSFSITPIALIAKCKPEVPFTTLITYFDLVKFFIFFQIVQ